MRVCVVGAGTSGLAAIRGLRRAGHEVRAYEAAAGIGGMWRYGDTAAYASLRTNTSRRRMQYPSLAIGRSVAEFPHHSEMLAYLERYAEANGLASSIELATRVQRARLGPDGGWEVELADRQGAPERFDALVVASGHYRDPEIPSLPGRFAGEIRHVRDYDAPEPYWGRRVVVLGAGQSALDIAAEVATVAERVTLSCRQGHHLVPRRVLGRPLDEFDRSTALLLPPAAVRALLELLIRAGRATPPRGGFPLAAHPLLQTRWPVVVSPALQAALEEGAIHHRPRIAALEADHVRFEDGTSEPADANPHATGYRVNFRFLPAELGRGRGWEFGLYRRVLSPHTPTLAFVGVLEPGPGLLEVVELQARWLGEVLAGRLAVPPAAQMWRAIDAGGERRSAAQFGQTGPHTLLCNRHAYLGVLGRDLRAAGRRSRRRRASAGLRQRWCPPGGGRGARDLAPERGSA